MPKPVDSRINAISDRHMDAARALLDMELAPEAKMEILALMQAFLALHNEYSKLNSVAGDVGYSLDSLVRSLEKTQREVKAIYAERLHPPDAPSEEGTEQG